ncbi:MAG: hypothetical protein K2H85_06160, partial [Allobaculum sp.]|nr:hypothetical protein [Allobaculum sp.]
MVTENIDKQVSEEKLNKIWKEQVGGRNALQGYSYQELYSCYLVLSAVDEDTKFRLEGIEDIDCIKTL